MKASPATVAHDLPVALYLRISDDALDLGLGVARQKADCLKLAKKRGWTAHVVYEDNDVSASRGRSRPMYDRMCADIRAGLLAAVVVWDVDRLTRTPAELESFIDLANATAIDLASVGGEIDLATPQGRLTARIKGAVARHEVEQSSRRLKRKSDELAAAGLPHGRVPWGWKRVQEFDDQGRKVRSTDVLDPEPAALLRQAAERVAAGDTLGSIVREWNARGIRTGPGNEWSATVLRRVLLQPRNAGLRQHRGVVLGPAQWEPAFPEPLWRQVVALLNDPSRRTNMDSRPAHLVSMIAKCGLCGGPMRSLLRTPNAKGERIRQYHCIKCMKIARKQSDVDALVVATTTRLLATTDASKIFARKGSEADRRLLTVKELQARLDTATDEFAEGHISGEQLARISARLRPELERAQLVYRSVMAEPTFADLAVPDIADTWESVPLARRRAVVRYLFDIVILPTDRGGGMWTFDPRTVSITRRKH